MCAHCPRLYTYGQLRAGWDGYGGTAPSPETVEEARETMHALKSAGMRIQDFGPTPDGGIDFEWDSETHHIGLSIEPFPGETHLFAERR